jgi:hypothetical protein
MSVATKVEVFLCGSCNADTWRKHVALPLHQAGIRCFNPREAEANARVRADVLLIVIDGEDRAIERMIEAAELIARGRTVALVVDDIAEGQVIDGERITGRQLDDLNRARARLRDLGERHGITIVHATVEAAVTAICRRLRP